MGGGSYAWQIIFKERKVINLVSIWQIGDGKKCLPMDTWVCAVINEDGPSWLEDRVVNEFLPVKLALS